MLSGDDEFIKFLLPAESRKAHAEDELDGFEYYFVSDDNKRVPADDFAIDEAVKEVQAFLSSPCANNKNDFRQLDEDEYKLIQELFGKYNTILPSSTAVEDIFGFTSKSITFINSH